jgi:hypothetical protein
MKFESIFHLDLLKRYQLLVKPGTYIVQVAYTVTDKNLILDDHPRYLVPLRVITGTGLEGIISELDKGAKVVPFERVSKHFLTAALWDNDDIDLDLPIKGERVKATFDDVDGRLLCTHIELLPREELDYVDVGSINDFKKDVINILNKNEITV